MQAYSPNSNQSPDLIRRFLWIAFLVSAGVTLTLAFCSRRGSSDAALTPVVEESASSDLSDPNAQPTLNTDRLLQTNSERPEFIQRAENLYEIEGAMLIKDLEDELEIEISRRDEDTIAGVVLSHLGRRARPGDEAQLGPLSVRVVEVDGNRIQTLRAKLDSTEATD